MNDPLKRYSPAIMVWLMAMMFCYFPTAGRAEAKSWQEQHDQLVARLRVLEKKAGDFGPAYQPLFRSALNWYEQWGGNPRHDVDDWMMSPEVYATELADALEHGRNYFTENPGALWPLSFETQLPSGTTVKANYWLTLPAGFSEAGRTFPLVVGLHGSGWLGHKISFVRKARKDTSAGRVFTVTPIDEAGPWQIDFLNAYLDELLRILPIDQDRVYVEGHSLGAMATWEWALENPEKFAAISPRSGRGEPFRAVRLKHVPAWVIHGANDDVVPSGFADQMVTALQACDASVKYSLLPDVAHNMPDDLDENQAVDWYLQHTRSHEPAPVDPRDGLGLTRAGFSPWETLTLPASSFWVSEPVSLADQGAVVRVVQTLFTKAHALGETVRTPLVEKLDRKTNTLRLCLAVPKTLRTGAKIDTTALARPAAQYVRFYFRGDTPGALAHLAKVTTEVEATGRHLADELWITPLTLWPETPTCIAEYRIEIK